MSVRTPARHVKTIVLVALAVLAGSIVATRMSRADNPGPVTRALDILPQPAALSVAAPGATASIADVAEKAVPSVVNISSKHVLRTRAIDPFFGIDRDGQPRERTSLGSGVIVSRDGVILTNNHVIADAREIKVTLADGRSFPAKVVGTDPKSDVAVIRLDSKVRDLVPIALADSDRLRLGDVVLAIGNPFGVGQTVTMGIVSAKGRGNMGIVDYENFIQTDAAINPGNSGGALVNLEGELVGINTAILSRTGGYQGIGFAIPSNMARPIMKSLLEDGRVRRGYLGVVPQDIDAELAAAMGLPSSEGVLISDVVDNGPAAKAGIQRGDVVVKIRDVEVHDAARLRLMIAEAGVGARLPMELRRGKRRLEVTVELAELPDDEQLAKQRLEESRTLGGLTVTGIDDAARQRYDLPRRLRQGVVVTDVDRGSEAAEVGLVPGDVILEVNEQRVSSAAGFTKAWNASGKRTLLLVYRDGRTVYAVIAKR